MTNFVQIGKAVSVEKSKRTERVSRRQREQNELRVAREREESELRAASLESLAIKKIVIYNHH